VTALDDPRRVRLEELYGEGLTNHEIAVQLGVSRERVRQLLHRYEIPIRPLRERRFLAAVTGRETEIAAAFVELRNDAAVAQRLGLLNGQVRRLIDATVPEADVLRRRGRNHQPRYSDAELIATLQRAALELSSPMGYQAFRIWAVGQQRHGSSCPGPQVVVLRFAGWRNALAQAGLPVNRVGGPHSTYDLDSVLSAIAACWVDLGRAPSVTGYGTWRAARAGIASPATARRFGASWDDLLAAAYPLVYGHPQGGTSWAAPLPAAATLRHDR